MNWLLIDVGTTGLKAAVVSEAGIIADSTSHSYPVHSDGHGHAEQHAEDWWQALLSCTRTLDLTSIESIGITGQMQDLILLDDKGRLLRNVILYSDTRATKEAVYINSIVSNDAFIEICGNEQTAASLLAKLLWLQEHESRTFSRAAHILMGAADYLIYKLTGQHVSDSSTASTTGLMSLSTRAWCEAGYFTKLGIHNVQRLFPQLLAGGTQVGQLHEQGQLNLRLSKPVPVFIGPGDAVATTLGMGSGDPQRPYAYLGTSGWVAFSAKQRGDPKQGIFNLAHPQQDMVVCIAPLLTAGATIDWIKTITGAKDYSSMIAKALAKDPTKLIFLPYLQGERSPFYDPQARASFVGLAQHHDQDDMVRAVLEGLVFAYKDALDNLISTSAHELGLTGGGSQSSELCQLFADITGMTVGVPNDASFTGVLGTLFACQQEQHKRQTLAHVYTPEQDHADTYEDKYHAFKRAYQQLKPIFAQLANNPPSKS